MLLDIGPGSALVVDMLHMGVNSFWEGRGTKQAFDCVVSVMA